MNKKIENKKYNKTYSFVTIFLLLIGVLFILLSTTSCKAQEPETNFGGGAEVGETSGNDF